MIKRSEYIAFVKDLLKNENGKDLSFLKKFPKTLRVFCLVCAMISGFIAGFFKDGSLQETICLVICVLFISLCFGLFVRQMMTKHRLKLEYISKILDYMLGENNYEFDPNGYVDIDIYSESGFPIANPMNYRGADKFTYSINDTTKFVISDLLVSRKKNDTKESLFNGSFGYIEFEQSFKCVLCMNTDYNNPSVKLEDVELESIDFNETFKVKTNNQIEARYILTPDTMQYFMELKKRTPWLKVTFLDNRIYIGMKRDLFEMKDLDGGLESVFAGIYDDLSIIMMIVNEINRNSKIFKIKK